MFSVHTVKVYITKEKLDGKMMSALLTGVNRAFPFIKGWPVSFVECC